MRALVLSLWPPVKCLSPFNNYTECRYAESQLSEPLCLSSFSSVLVLLFWALLSEVSLCVVSFSLVRFCWAPFWWVFLCLVSFMSVWLCWASFSFVSLCWVLIIWLLLMFCYTEGLFMSSGIALQSWAILLKIGQLNDKKQYWSVCDFGFYKMRWILKLSLKYHFLYEIEITKILLVRW